MSNIRNFCIIAHIDHGKSTLADRFLELTETVAKRQMKEQYLDQMELERERGITIKLQPVRMKYVADGTTYELNLIDTPGHVDFSYEVSRSLAAVEGAILLVDATKGIQAQTLANLNLARRQELVIIPAVNKVDMPTARTAQVKEELAYLLEVEPGDIMEVSGKTGKNVRELLDSVVRRVPSPQASHGDGIPRAVIFDSTFDAYKGVIAFVRVTSGVLRKGERLLAWATGARPDALEVGSFAPRLTPGTELREGQIGYVATGLKDPGQIRVGDTLTRADVDRTRFTPLPGYREMRPMVFASLFPENAEQYDELKDALGKLKLTDAALQYEPESSAGLGRGFRLGFLGMLHVEIVTERLSREFGLKLIVTTPSVEYLVKLKDGSTESVRSAALLPDPSRIAEIAEPVTELEVICPSEYVGPVMELISGIRNTYIATDYLGTETAVLKYRVPLAEIVTDFYDRLKSVSQGYASMGYEPSGHEPYDLVRLDILVAGEPVEAFARIVPREQAQRIGRLMVEKLKETLPQQWFQVTLQAAVGGKVLAREDIRALRKDVTGYLYGGDVTRKMKLLKKQKEGKAKMKEQGKVQIPHDVFLKMLKK
ncbi:MAG TPA: translation elongation factor 4 [Candidatus Paceibacterota bacterium]|nr:translation elongation factor 4 [Candidatus Paceibacterota bacterium]